MSKSPALMVMVQLTDSQRRQIREQTGQDIDALPYESGASSVRCEFGGLTLRVTRGVFVPAQATEHLLQSLLDAMRGRDAPIIIDVGTGCGAVALAAAAALPRSIVIATD